MAALLFLPRRGPGASGEAGGGRVAVCFGQAVHTVDKTRDGAREEKGRRGGQ